MENRFERLKKKTLILDRTNKFFRGLFDETLNDLSGICEYLHLLSQIPMSLNSLKTVSRI